MKPPMISVRTARSRGDYPGPSLGWDIYLVCGHVVFRKRFSFSWTQVRGGKECTQECAAASPEPRS